MQTPFGGPGPDAIGGQRQLEPSPALVDNDSMKVDWLWSRFRFPGGAEAAREVILAMNVLQSTRDGATTMTIIDECMKYHISYLPPETTRILHYQPALSEGSPLELFDRNITPEEFQSRNKRFRINNKKFFDDVANATWTFLPLAVNQHFTCIILHCKKRDMPGTRRGYRVVIQNAFVADPERNATDEQLMWDRLREVFTEKRGFLFKHHQPVKLWFPKQFDPNTCGFRVYDIMKIMMERVSQSVAEEGLKAGYSSQVVWQDMSGDFQPDKVRAEMIGILANVAMRYTHWSTRICLVPVTHVKDRTIGALADTWVETATCGARLTSLPNRNPMQYSETTMVDNLLRMGLDSPPGSQPTPMQISPDFFPPRALQQWTQLPPRQPSPPSPPGAPGPSTPNALGLTTPQGEPGGGQPQTPQTPAQAPQQGVQPTPPGTVPQAQREGSTPTPGPRPSSTRPRPPRRGNRSRGSGGGSRGRPVRWLPY